MPPALHDLFIGQFGLAVLDAVREVGRQNEQARAFTESINNALSSGISMIDGDDQWEQQPDAQFGHDEADCPSLVIEVALTQNAGHLRKIAHQYIYHTEGDIEMAFRDADKRPVPGALTLHLHDFAPHTLCQGCPNLPLSISYHDISNMMAKAELSMELRKRRKDRTPKRITKRRYVESSEDKMGTDDEKCCSHEADNAIDKEDGDNGAYKPQES
ncbi:hypothetical protein DER44DRAFT_741877 [Fusarium oxysporum]|nr:hypothetical protein DER44DRAFT_741877 [Fusarium oxysporum]